MKSIITSLYHTVGGRRAAMVALLIGASAGAVHAGDMFSDSRKGWLEIAENCKPALHETIYRPVAVVTPVRDEQSFQNWRYREAGSPDSLIYSRSFKDVESVTVDFGRHMTGFFSFNTRILERCQDAPVRIRFTFGELPAEINTPYDPWPGTLSRAWMQEEVMNITNIGETIEIPRRMACRYVKIELLGASNDFDFALDDMSFRAVSSAKGEIEMPVATASDRMRKIHDVSVETLRECMQTVFEDGPKRDRRLWSGDLYLQSLANRYTFRNFDLTKRCLYLFAGLSTDDGEVISNIFEYPEPHPQIGSLCLSYSLLWNSTLLEYLRDTDDYETARNLWPVAVRQVEKALACVDSEYMFNPNLKPEGWFFFDWRDGLDVNTAMQAAIIFGIHQTAELAEMLGKSDEVRSWLPVAKKMKEASRKRLYDGKTGLFVSGGDRQVSILSQTWMIKAGVLDKKEARKAINAALANEGTVMPGTPYAMHYLVDAMILADMPAEARDLLETYWGGMVDKGADTFWESYDPDDDFISAYSFHPLNSACHAWSCTPVYFIHKYPEIFI
ncbi:MAG: glycoside hydrolase [Muribaculaceae bacterium]|nr:glycoside hydrolase [Muribaculaceae bacterium]